MRRTTDISEERPTTPSPPVALLVRLWAGGLALVCTVLSLYFHGASNDLALSEFSHWAAWLWAKYGNPPWVLILLACTTVVLILPIRDLVRHWRTTSPSDDSNED